MSWSVRRQLFILLIVFVVIGGLFFLVFRNTLFPTPMCTDNKQNGTETGIDCGGSCNLLCADATSPLVVKWTRSFLVAQDIYNAIAYIENRNINAAVTEVSYEFRLYDENRQFITARTGTTYIAANNANAIFEGQIKVGDRTPKYTTFTFSETPHFTKVDARTLGKKVIARDGVVADWDTRPTLAGSIVNASSLNTISNIDVIAILYDGEDNAIAISKTFLASLAPGASTEAYFTWPNPFPTNPVRVEIIPRFNALQGQ